MEDWAGLCRRVAKTVARNETEERQFFEIMVYGLFLPNTPALSNAGRPDFTLSSCFVPRLSNGVHNILDCIRTMAIIQKMGGGTGFCLDDPDLPAQLPVTYRPTFLIKETHPDVALTRANMLKHADLKVVESGDHFDKRPYHRGRHGVHLLLRDAARSTQVYRLLFASTEGSTGCYHPG